MRGCSRGDGGSGRRATTRSARRTARASAALERLEDVEKPYEPWDLRLSLGSGARSGRIVARLEQAVLVRGSFRLGPLDFELGLG